MNNSTNFEKKLAEQIPQLRRDVKSEILNEMNRPVVLMKLQMYQSKLQKTLRHGCCQIQDLARQYLVVGVCCFFLGAASMFGIMTCTTQNYNTNLSGQDSTQTNKETANYKVIPPPITAEFLDGINSPAGLSQKIMSQNFVYISQPEPPVTRQNIFQNFQM
jgi:hypothetical protein